MCPPRPSLGEHVHYTSLTNCNQSSLRALSLPLSLSPPSLPFLMLSPLSHALSSHLISLSLSLCLSPVSVCLSVFLSVCQSVSLSVCLSACLSHIRFFHSATPPGHVTPMEVFRRQAFCLPGKAAMLVAQQDQLKAFFGTYVTYVPLVISLIVSFSSPFHCRYFT